MNVILFEDTFLKKQAKAHCLQLLHSKGVFTVCDFFNFDYSIVLKVSKPRLCSSKILCCFSKLILFQMIASIATNIFLLLQLYVELKYISNGKIIKY